MVGHIIRMLSAPNALYCFHVRHVFAKINKYYAEMICAETKFKLLQQQIVCILIHHVPFGEQFNSYLCIHI